MITATWNDKVIAKSDNTVLVEGNHYFPFADVNFDMLSHSKTETSCHWKGTASYFNIEVDGQSNIDAAFTYKTPKDEASNILDHVAFWRGVQVKVD